MNAALISVDRLIARSLPAPRQVSPEGPLLDRLLRPLSDLRLSVTDRCNFRCGYCMPRGKSGLLAQGSTQAPELSFEELTQVTAAFVALGVKKVRITGGEPLVRRNLAGLVEQLSRLALDDLCMTTNGSLLADQARALAHAGLHRVTVSLDAIDEVTFHRMTDANTPLRQVLLGIDAARKTGLDPVKINMVVKRGINEDSIVPMAAWARREGLELRYIEYMDVGCSNGWKRAEVLSAAEIHERIHRTWPLENAATPVEHETASSYRYRDGGGKIGIVASITRPFCGSCVRARVSARGAFYPCLFAPQGFDLGATLRNGGDLTSLVAGLWRARGDRYSELRASLPTDLPRPEMSSIGG